MKNKKGFTLIELLAMMVVLGVLMMVAIPNIGGILGNHRLNSFKADAENLVEAAKIKIAKDTTIDEPNVGECLVFTLDYVDDNDDFKNGPNGGSYEQQKSIVVVRKVSASGVNIVKMEYFVTLIETKDSKSSGIFLLNATEIDKMKNSDFKELETIIDTSKDREDSVSKLIANSTFTGICSADPTKIRYYAHR